MMRDKYKDAYGLSLMFIFGVVVHIALYFTVFGFSRALRVGDEVRYYDIARSFFNGTGLRIRDLPTAWQKIGYSLVLMPFFALNDVALRLKAIGIANIIIMNLSVIFVWLLCSELELNRRAKYCIAFLTAIWPDMMYSMGYMSEVLYWPLTVLIFWLWLLNERKQSFTLAITEGIICYITYLTKEVALAFIIAFSAFEIIYPAICFMLSGDKAGRRFKEFYSRRKFLLLGVVIAIFALFHILVKLTFFYGLGNTYNQMGIKAIMSPYNFMYVFYAFFYYIAALLVASLIIPVVFPLVNFRRMNDAGRKLFCCLVLFGLTVSATIAYTISVRETLGFITPSIHLRYYGSFFVVLLSCFLVSMQSTYTQGICLDRRFFAEILTLAVTYACFMFRGITSTASIDQYILLWHMAIEKVAGVLFPPAGSWEVLYPSAVIVSLLLIALATMFYRTYTNKGSEKAQKFFIAVQLIVTLGLNVAAGTVIIYAYRVNSEAVNEVVRINDYFKYDNNSNILYLNYGDRKYRYDYWNRYTDTYMDRRHHFYVINYDELVGKMSGDIVPVNEITLKGELRVATSEIYHVYGIDYILLENTNSSGQRKLAGVEPVTELCGEHFTVYKNIDRNTVRFAD